MSERRIEERLYPFKLEVESWQLINTKSESVKA